MQVTLQGFQDSFSKGSQLDLNQVLRPEVISASHSIFTLQTAKLRQSFDHHAFDRRAESTAGKGLIGA